MKPLFTVNRRDKRRPVQTGGGGGGEPSSDLLSWNPGQVCPLSNPTTRNVSASGNVTITLDPGEHTRITLNGGGGTVSGRISINGVYGTNNRVWVGTNTSGNYNGGAGGKIRNTLQPTSGGSGTCLSLRNINISYVEGIWFDKGNTVGDAIAVSATDGSRAGSVYIQHCLVTGVHYYTTAGQNHGDAFQLNNTPNIGDQLFIDKFTAYTWNQGIFWNSNSSSVAWNNVDLRRVNVQIYDTNLISTDPNGACPPHGHTCFWFMTSSGHIKYPVQLSDCWAWDRQMTTGPFCSSSSTRRTLSLLIGDANALSALGASVSGDAYTGTWNPGSTLTSAGWTGVIRGGIPPNGDWVNGGTISGSGGSGSTVTHSGNFTGLNYTTPGYQ